MHDNGATNGQATAPVDMGHVAEVLQDEVSVGYKPNLPLEGMWAGGGEMPTVTLRRDLEFMQTHPVVTCGLDYYKSGIAGAEFWGGPDHQNPDNPKGKDISPDPRVSQFVLAHVERFWQRGMPVLQEGAYPYGWAPGEHVYKESMGMLVWSHLKGFHPHDGFILTYQQHPVGIRIKNVRDPVGGPVPGRRPSMSGQVDLWFASGNIPAKAAWYPHRPRFQQFYGRSQLIGAWRPWRRLAWRDGVEQVIDAAIYRAGYVGPTVRHPKEDAQTAMSGVAGTRPDGAGSNRRSARDIALQIIQWAKAGAGFAISSENYPQQLGGGPKWEVKFPEHVMDVSPLINAAGSLEDQIMLGMGVPPELVKAGGTGSGYSGRSIPREAFLDGQQRVADAMLQIFVEQVVKPLVLWNFGDVPFEVSCKPLLKSQVENKQGQPQPPLPQPADDQGQQQPGMPPDGGQSPGGDQPSQGPAMSLDAPSSRVMEIVRRVLRKPGLALSTDAGGREHRGKGKGGGQFVKGSGGRAASPAPSPTGTYDKEGATTGPMIEAIRVGAGKDAKIVLHDGSPGPSHITPAMVPPDWNDVIVSQDPDAELLVKAYDSKGRPKSVYSDKHTMRTAALKFARVDEMMRQSATIDLEIQDARADPKTKEQAECAWLMSMQATRPGSKADTGAKVKAYGATTLEGRHVLVDPVNGKVRLRFVGKEGVLHDHAIRDPGLAAMLKERKERAGDRGQIFRTSESAVDKFIGKLDGGHFSAKDFRTRRANIIAIKAIARFSGMPKDDKEYKRRVKAVAYQVSTVLGNKPQQCLESYINPAVFSVWQGVMQ